MGDGISKRVLAASFHRTLAYGITETMEHLCTQYNIKQVILCGGVFQNRRLIEEMMSINHDQVMLLPRQVPLMTVVWRWDNYGWVTKSWLTYKLVLKNVNKIVNKTVRYIESYILSAASSLIKEVIKLRLKVRRKYYVFSSTCSINKSK